MDLERLLVPLILTFKVAFLRKAIEMVASCEKIENCGSCDDGENFDGVCVCDVTAFIPIQSMTLSWRIHMLAVYDVVDSVFFLAPDIL